jgi:hypothetical protein
VCSASAQILARKYQTHQKKMSSVSFNSALNYLIIFKVLTEDDPALHQEDMWTLFSVRGKCAIFCAKLPNTPIEDVSR